MSKKTDYWTEYEKQVAEWFASGDCNYFNKAMDKVSNVADTVKDEFAKA